MLSIWRNSTTNLYSSTAAVTSRMHSVKLSPFFLDDICLPVNRIIKNIWVWDNKYSKNTSPTCILDRSCHLLDALCPVSPAAFRNDICWPVNRSHSMRMFKFDHFTYINIPRYCFKPHKVFPAFHRNSRSTVSRLVGVVVPWCWFFLVSNSGFFFLLLFKRTVPHLRLFR